MSAKYTIPFTQSGYESFKKEYEDLLAKRPEIVQELSTARDMGDRSENAAYKYARRKLSSTDSRLAFLKRILDHAKAVKPSQSDRIEIGSIVDIKTDERALHYQIVGEYEADPSQGRISYRSPVGRSLLGKHAGESVIIRLPNGDMQYTVTKISI